MADPFPPSEARERRIGAIVSGALHAALIGALALGGALFRAPQSPAIRMAPVETMSVADFEAMAAASRGTGPVSDTASATPAQPRAPADEIVAGIRALTISSEVYPVLCGSAFKNRGV